MTVRYHPFDSPWVAAVAAAAVAKTHSVGAHAPAAFTGSEADSVKLVEIRVGGLCVRAEFPICAVAPSAFTGWRVGDLAVMLPLAFDVGLD